jgi:type I restriction enzyme S subunit
MTGIIGGISRNNFADLLIPIPPHEEQKAIAQKVNTLMGLCDEMEKQINNSQTQIEQLTQSCLREVFEG